MTTHPDGAPLAATENPPMTTRSPRNPRKKNRAIPTRRGVVGVLAMMFLVLFASLAAAMGIATQGNLRSAASHLRVVRALGAVDTGMSLGVSRLREALGRFVVTKGEVDSDYIEALWYGPIPSDPPVFVNDPPFNMPESTPPGSILAALGNIYDVDEEDNLVATSDPSNAPAGISLLNPGQDWLVTAPIGLARNGDDKIVTAAQVSYSPPDADGNVTILVTGYDWDPARDRWVTRSARQQFRIAKRIEFAIVSNTAPLLGVGGNVVGPIGSMFNSDSLDTIDGNPFVSMSDFYGFDADLDTKLDDYYAYVVLHDSDGDNRLSATHAGESQGLDQLNLIDYDDDDAPDKAFLDFTKDDVVDDFDIFIRHYDTNGDGRVTVSAALAEGTSAEGAPAEFTANDNIALLIDSGNPDRNDNGFRNGDFIDGEWVWSTFDDNSDDGLLDDDDLDPDDVTLGYRDGYLDYKDRYAKVTGRILLTANKTAWEQSTDKAGDTVDNYQQFTQGPFRVEDGAPPIMFDAADGELPSLTADSFAEAADALRAIAAEGATFDSQVTAQTGGGPPDIRVEATPFGAASAADWYARPVYEGLTFKNVVIPMGTNALFIDCEFIGVTKVETYTQNTHPSFIFYGEQDRDPATGDLEYVYPPPPDLSDAALDKTYADEEAPGYDALPDALIVNADIDGDGSSPDTCYDTKLISNNIRFHDCLFVGSIVADQPAVYHHVRNKLQFTGATRFAQVHPDYPDDPSKNPDADDMDEILKSSLMAPQYSVDIGAINPPPEQDVKLKGAIVAGVLDVRGNAFIKGVILATFNPVYGEAPLVLYDAPVGNPADFNVTIGYVTTSEGDLEAINADDLADLDSDGNLDIGWDSARDATGALIPTAGWDGSHEDWWYDGVPDDAATPGTHVRRAIQWNPPGITRVEADPDAILPDGLSLPLQAVVVAGSYQEGRQ